VLLLSQLTCLVWDAHVPRGDGSDSVEWLIAGISQLQHLRELHIHYASVADVGGDDGDRVLATVLAAVGKSSVWRVAMSRREFAPDEACRQKVEDFNAKFGGRKIAVLG
jgi:hypothetical protein